MNTSLYIGFSASILEIISVATQTFYTIKSRMYQGLSVLRIFIDLIVCCLWIVYAMYIKDIPIGLASICISILNIIILGYYYYDKNHNVENRSVELHSNSNSL